MLGRDGYILCEVGREQESPHSITYENDAGPLLPQKKQALETRSQRRVIYKWKVGINPLLLPTTFVNLQPLHPTHCPTPTLHHDYRCRKEKAHPHLGRWMLRPHALW